LVGCFNMENYLSKQCLEMDQWCLAKPYQD
jgi:hypothetical protein